MAEITIDELKNKIISYFKDNIMGRDDTIVEDIQENFEITNKGHGIVFKIKDSNYGPIYYAEKLMDDLKNSSINELAEKINKNINNLDLYKMRADLAHSLDPDGNMIITAMPTSSIPENYGLSDTEYRQDPVTGITIFIKTLIPKSPVPNTYAHVRKLDNDEMIKAYQFAYNNTLRALDLHAVIQENGVADLPTILIHDANQFVDYFYLIYNNVLDKIMSDQKLKKMYILPISAYAANTICIPDDMPKWKENILTDAIQKIITDYHDEHPIMPIVSYRKKTKKFKTVLS